ncbi:MAG: helix-turn-helix domain-containing protein [Polyangiaceae bacterium]|nr:helix-turn-helix domain-containing protein [Polyangiaceae bacterium]
MKPEEIRALREALHCSATQLGETLGVGAETVRAWERAELFPTKRWVAAMARLFAEGPAAVHRKRRRTCRAETDPVGIAVLARPEVQEIVRKLGMYPELMDQVQELASTYEDPGEAD